MGSRFGRMFTVTTYGESHGGGIGAIVEGCPPRVKLDLAALQADLDRRRPGQSILTTQRRETDEVTVLSGLSDEGLTLGSPLALAMPNRDARPEAYREMQHRYRPSHADFTTDAKYGIRAWAGGGRASARETAARVAAGAIARQVLATLGPVEIVAWVQEVHGDAATVDEATVDRAAVDANEVRCPEPEAAARFRARILEARDAGDTVGGVVAAVARGLPAGLGDPVFDKLDADLAKAMISLPAAKGVEIGSGFAGTRLTGQQHNDVFLPGADGTVRTATNHSGGVQGGISNGMPIRLAVAFKPVSTVFVEQATVDDRGAATTLKPRGRHDPCVLPRAVPIVEAMMAIVLLDHWLRWRGQVGEMPPG
ncbi:MAG: chorismate synthase [Myxococcota bacterium]